MARADEDEARHWRELFDRRADEASDDVARNGFVMRAGTARLRQLVRDLVGPVSGAEILDAGCGAGSVSAGFAAANRVVGLDVVPGMLALAARKGLEPVEGSMLAPPFPPESFDVVMAVESISLLPRPLLAIKALAGVLRPGGLLVVSCVNRQSLPRRLAESALDLVGRPYPNAVSLAELETAMTRAGITPEMRVALTVAPGFACPTLPVRRGGAVLRLANNVVVKGRKRG